MDDPRSVLALSLCQYLFNIRVLDLQRLDLHFEVFNPIFALLLQLRAFCNQLTPFANGGAQRSLPLLVLFPPFLAYFFAFVLTLDSTNALPLI